ncbi:MAG: cob(I)yrinic acid a,c-diamide adenosyltransferase [Oscillospiraceae bacterium]|jgi:cob(I)alamin adenosyltransferase|nr:cob(I)yrinic acid a,c-diamide adenosyltransferase [Oscillospiraceae bacterium]
MTHLYFGDGKGKTTAALGLLLRAAGCGWKCVLVQFLKDWDCGELRSLERLTDITVLRGKAEGAAFARDMSADQLEKTRAMHEDNLRRAMQLCGDGGMLVLDEAADAIKLGLLGEDTVRELMEQRRGREDAELVITGHSVPDWILQRSDYITELVKRRHPYDNGVLARRGIEW